MLIAAELANEIHGMSISRRVLWTMKTFQARRCTQIRPPCVLIRNTNPGVQEVLKTIIGVLAIRSYERMEKGKFTGQSGKSFVNQMGSGGLGFRDLIKFNAALLAKQGWRLTNNDMSLFYRVFKSKYFPDCSWLEENPKQCGSYAWQKYHE
uniref:Uncharacterized protein n=1 Tax=Fagus sylvatica TaxID=28930 RepID=A0A2N9F5V1_FAGSY